MAKQYDPENPLKPHTAVRSVVDLPGVPVYTEGKVELANGISWLRYWVRFDNGVRLGHVSHGDVIPVKQWDSYLSYKERAAVEAAEAEARAAAAAEAGESAGGAAVAEGAPVINGVSIPPHLLERSAAARVRLGG